jgi:ribonuclease-3
MDKKEKQHLEKLCKILHVKMKNIGLLKKAITHRSYINEHKNEKLEHNERLEFLGDAVLELLVSKHLFDNYPSKPEGDLTSFRAATVRTESLAEEAEKLKIGKFIFMSKGEEQTGGRTRPYILANTFEAVVGAIYLDRGISTVSTFLKNSLFYKIPDIIKNRTDIDNKSKLQEISQEIVKETPEYEIVDATGPDHAKVFTAQVLIKEKKFGQGKGANKQEAEQSAAEKALRNWKKSIAKYFGID